MADITEALQWYGRTVVDPDDKRLGKIAEVYFDTRTAHGEWALLTTGLFSSDALLPLHYAASEGQRVRTPYTRGQVKRAPRPNAARELSNEEEAALCTHYRLDPDETVSGLRAIDADDSGR